MVNYADMSCRQCGHTIVPSLRHVARPRPVRRYSDCYFKCPACACAYSNAREEPKRTKVFPRKEDNIPEEVHDGLAKVLAQSLNETSRTSKAHRFAFETSEDAVTWVVFRYLRQTRQVSPALGRGTQKCDAILFWGVQHPPSLEQSLRHPLVSVLRDTLHEDPSRLSEPDVILLLDETLVFIEAKYTSANDRKPGYINFPRYLEPPRHLFSKTATEVAADGYYELTRNWVIGSLLARQLNMTFLLVNLANPACADSARRFAASLRQSERRRFEFITWADLLSRTTTPHPKWFETYLQRHSF